MKYFMRKIQGNILGIHTFTNNSRWQSSERFIAVFAASCPAATLSFPPLSYFMVKLLSCQNPRRFIEVYNVFTWTELHFLLYFVRFDTVCKTWHFATCHWLHILLHSPFIDLMKADRCKAAVTQRGISSRKPAGDEKTAKQIGQERYNWRSHKNLQRMILSCENGSKCH